MYNKNRTIKTLELDKILKLLAAEASLDDAANLALNLNIQTDITSVKESLQNTFDAFNLSATSASPNFGRATNVNAFLERCAAGGSMNCKEFLTLGETLRVIRSVRDWRYNSSDSKKTSLDDMFNALQPNKYLEDKIHSIIKSEDEISDSASLTLSDIRRKISAASLDIRNRLDKIIKNPNKSKFLQDSIVTQRDGRFVVPVKQEFRSEIGGIVHDTSASGSTLFIEPIAVVEINNDIRVLKAKEKEEIERILFELSAEAGNFKESISLSYSNLVKLSLIFAKASLAYKMRASIPNLNTNGHVYLKNARHPLLDKNKVVPITVELGKNYNSLIITGPNTGGKTVTLKTVGLLTLMAMCGLMIPADDNCEIALFKDIYVDIGDEQSIEQSLSTFSSHLVNIIDILNEADNTSLVLVDELGGGTDPIEGAALARAILLNMHRKYVKLIATTHYAELKTFALDTEGVENACCEFDINTLKPTYRLLIGVPGRSNAFAIADSLGICKDIITEASSFLNEDDTRFERVIALLEKSRQETEKDQNEIRELKASINKQKSELDKRLEKVNAECEKILKSAKEKANNLLETTRYKSNELINNLEETGKALNKENAAKLLNDARIAANRSILGLEKTVDPIDNVQKDDYILPRPLVVGDNISLFSLNQNGIVAEINSAKNKVLVNIGSIKTWVDISDVRLCDKPTVNKTKTVKNHISRSVLSEDKRGSALELDIRGFTVDEGLLELDRYIDQSLRSNVNYIAIIHGKGTGALRSAVHTFLKKHPSVAFYRLGTFGEGESGVTIVELK